MLYLPNSELGYLQNLFNWMVLLRFNLLLFFSMVSALLPPSADGSGSITELYVTKYMQQDGVIEIEFVVDAVSALFPPSAIEIGCITELQATELVQQLLLY